MPQIAMTALGDTVVHLRMPRRRITLCGKQVVSYGTMLPPNRSDWPDAEFCEPCITAYVAPLAADAPTSQGPAPTQSVIRQGPHAIAQALAELQEALADEPDPGLADRLRELRELLDAYAPTLKADDSTDAPGPAPDDDPQTPES